MVVNCRVVNCESPSIRKGYCVMHYSRWRRGTPLTNQKKHSNKGKMCQIQSCGRIAYCKGLCSFHDQRERIGIPPDAPIQYRNYHPPVFCSISGCLHHHLARGLCSLHWQRQKAGIPLELPEGYYSLFAGGWKDSSPYRKVSINGKEYAEHRVIARAYLGRELLPNEVVHHKDEDKSNNEPSNLQVMTRSEHTLLHNALRRERRLERKMLRLSGYQHTPAA